MNIKDLDLNLLRLFDAVWRTRSVSRAAELLDLSQPAASQGLARLRRLLGDGLFVRAGTGVAPTPRAERLALAVQQALATLENDWPRTLRTLHRKRFQALIPADAAGRLQQTRLFRQHGFTLDQIRHLFEPLT